MKVPRSMEDVGVLRNILSFYIQNHYYPVLSAFLFLFIFMQSFTIPGRFSPPTYDLIILFSIPVTILMGGLFDVIPTILITCLVSYSLALLMA